MTLRTLTVHCQCFIDNNFCCSNNTENQSLRETPCNCMVTETLPENTTCEKKIRSKTTFHVQCPVHPVNQVGCFG